VPRRGFEELADWPAQSILTPREIDVIEAIGLGLSNKAIARELGISLHTVKFHIESLLRKLGARTRAEAVAKAMERRKKETLEL
jgi:DNA-binding NarL/FixJ family response regulator